MECLYDENIVEGEIGVCNYGLFKVKVDCSCLLSDHFFNTIGMQREKLSD